MNIQQVEELHRIYESTTRPMNVVVFGSGSGTNLRALLEVQEYANYRVRALFTDRKCPIIDIGKEFGIPTIYHSFVRFFKDNNEASRSDYDLEIVRQLDFLTSQVEFEIDLIFLAGYMRVVHSPLLERYKIINVHPADLAVLDSQGKRCYVGDKAMELALRDGNTRTRSCVHVVTQELDGGPVIVSGPWVPYTTEQVTSDSIKTHQERQKKLSDWPAAIKAVELISDGRVSISDNGTVYIDHQPQPSSGFEM